jgi:hypothetical protein
MTMALKRSSKDLTEAEDSVHLAEPAATAAQAGGVEEMSNRNSHRLTAT